MILRITTFLFYDIIKAFQILVSIEYDFSWSILLIRLHTVVQLFSAKFLNLIEFYALEFHTSRRTGQRGVSVM